MSKIRIQKVLAEAGVASRRAVEAMILEGRVEVNGQLVTDLPCFVDPASDHIRVDGQNVAAPSAAKTCILLNKPRGVVCARRDRYGRPRVYDLIRPMKGQVYCVGSLDVDSTGLVLLTNDGDLANRLNHPRYGVTRTYVVEVDGRIDARAVDKIAAGVFIDGRRAVPQRVRLLRRGGARSVLEVQLVESAGREVRQVLARLGYKSRRLKRTGLGPVTDARLKVGQFRVLAAREAASLRRAASGDNGGRGQLQSGRA